MKPWLVSDSSSVTRTTVPPLNPAALPNLERRNLHWDTWVFLPGSWESSFRRYLLQAFARQRHAQGRVFCIERPRGPRWPRMRHIQENLWVITPAVAMHPLIAEHLPGMSTLNHALLRRQLQRSSKTAGGTEQRSVVWLFHPYQDQEVNLWPHELLIYDCYDRYDAPPEPTSASWKKRLLQREQNLLAKTSLVLTVSQPLLEWKSAQGVVAQRVPNAVDWEFFGQAADDAISVPDDLAHIPGPRLGFIGQMSDRIDFVLLDQLAEQQPQHSLILIGEVQGPLHSDKRHALERLKQRPNVYFLGARPYEQLPRYLKGFDVCLIPYDDSLFNYCSSPLKIYEYLAAGKPIVSVSTPEIDTFHDVVHVVPRRADFPRAVEAELQQITDASRRHKRVARARQNSWEHRAAQIIQLIQARGVPPPTAQKVLHLVTGLDVGDGIIETVAALTSQQSRHTFLPIICGLRGGGHYESIFQEQGISVHGFDLGAPQGYRQYLRLWGVLRQVRRLIQQERIQILHAHNFFAGVVGLLASAGIPHLRRIVTMHGYYYFEGWRKTPLRAGLRYHLLSRFFRAWDSVVGVSSAVGHWVRSFQTTHTPIQSVLNGIRPERFSAPVDAPLYRQRWKIPDSAPLIGTLGIVEKVKGGDCFLEAAKSVLTQHPDSYFVFIGARADHEPDTFRALQAQVERLGLQGRVIFTDRVLDVANAIAALDVFVFASTHAGFGLAVAEAMYLGKPVVATSVGGIPEMIQSGENGLLVPPQDPRALHQAIDTLLSDRPFAERLGQAGRAQIEQGFLAQRMAADYERLYHHVLERTPEKEG